MPSPRNQLAITIDRERRQLEVKGVRAAALLASRARRYALASLRIGHDPVAAVRRVLKGDKRTREPGITPLIIDNMVAAHLAGRRRTDVIAAPRFRSATKIKLAGTVYDEAIDFLQSRLDLDEGQIDDLRKLYETPALRVTDQAATALENRLQRTLLTTTQQGLSVRDGTKALRQAFDDEGFAPEENYRLEAMFRTQTQIAYSAGRENSLNDPAIQEILWGFEFVAIQDDRTTKLCSELDGMKRPKDDPVWETYTPPNHYNCRSTVIEIFDEEGATPVPRGIEPVPGFGINFGRVFVDSISSASELVTS